jgi:hypothetical protein
MEHIFNTFDLLADVSSGHTKVGLLLEVSWWVELVDRGEWGDLI